MAGRADRAFTLVELLMVIAIVGLLAALLMPAASAVWQMAMVTRCRANLKTIWKAQCAWQAEERSSSLVAGARWTADLLPYVEQVAAVFTCPVGPDRRTGEPVYEAAALAFDVYAGETYQWTIGIDSEWARKTNTTGNQWLVEFEDLGYIGGGDADFNDIRCTVWFEGGLPSKVRMEEGESGYHHDLVVNGRVVLVDVNSHVGYVVHLDAPSTLSDYGLSLGTYESAGQELGTVDPRSFFILDYAKTVADYNGDGYEDRWDRYFFTDADAWLEEYGADGDTDWRLYQALRHQGKANVLFCDGHVRLLGPEELYETNPSWRYAGNSGAEL